MKFTSPGCSESFVHQSRRKHPTQKFVRHHRHHLNYAQMPALVSLVPHHSQDMLETSVEMEMEMDSHGGLKVTIRPTE